MLGAHSQADAPVFALKGEQRPKERHETTEYSRPSGHDLGFGLDAPDLGAVVALHAPDLELGHYAGTSSMLVTVACDQPSQNSRAICCARALHLEGHAVNICVVQKRPSGRETVMLAM